MAWVKYVVLLLFLWLGIAIINNQLDMPWWLYLLLAFLVMGAFFTSSVDKIIYFKSITDMQNKLTAQGVNSTQKFLSTDKTKGIAINEDEAEVYLISKFGEKANILPVPYKDILSSEIIEDGQSITKTQRGSQIGGALVGGLLFGGVGVVLGGLSGKRGAANRIKSIDLRITINNTLKFRSINQASKP